MIRRIKVYIILLFLILGISQSTAQCWFLDLKEAYQNTNNTEFKNYITGETGLENFSTLYETARSRSFLTNRELLDFSKDLARVPNTNSFITTLIENAELINGWKKFYVAGNNIPDSFRQNLDILSRTRNWKDALFFKLINVRNSKFFKEVDQNPNILNFFEEGSQIIRNRASNLKAVELDMYALDRARTSIKSIFKEGTNEYVPNHTRRNLTELDINLQSGKIRDANGNVLNTDNVNGEGLMYVIDEFDNIIIGSRGGLDNNYPHPTLIGGRNPNVKMAGMIRFKNGRIFEINNISGHFKPPRSMLDEAERIFRNRMPKNSFDTKFSVTSIQ